MPLLDEMRKEVAGIFSQRWSSPDGKVVPDPEDLLLSNDARYFKRATVLYADLSGSTMLVDEQNWQIAGEVYKTYLLCAAKLVRDSDGVIAAYDGDRIMGIFIGDYQTTEAAKCGLKINWTVRNVINPALRKQYPDASYEVKQVVGIDTSEIRAARIGVRGGNDLVWIGRAANYAAKLTTSRNDYQTWLTTHAFNRLNDEAKFGGNPRQLMWKTFKWTCMNDQTVYGSSWTWEVA
jgi:class 3 adenylate cyclase